MMRIPFFKLTLTADDKLAVMNVLESGWLTFGQKAIDFETAFARYIGAPYCVAINSCTQALFLCLEYLKSKNDFRAEGPIAVPSLTCAATAHVLRWAGIPLRFVDIDPETFAMQKTDLWSIPVHYAGKYNEQPNILIEDSAHRILPKSFKGNLTCFSFYVTKNLTCGESGMIACNTLAEKEWFESARLYGLSKGAWRRYDVKGGWHFSVDFAGWKCNPTDIACSLGLSQLNRIDEMNTERRNVAQLYDELLGESHDWQANHLYPILINERDNFIEEMKNKGIQCSVHFPPLHQQPAYVKEAKGLSLPVTDWVAEHIVSLPFWPYMPIDMVTEVAKEVNEWREKYGTIIRPNFTN